MYALLDPRKPGIFRYGHWVFHHEPFYVGKGHGERCHAHTYDYVLAKNTNTPKNAKIRKIIRVVGDNPIIQIKKQQLTEKQAFSTEIQLISKIGRYNLGEGPLTNLTDGGDGVVGHIFTEASRKKIREGLRNSEANRNHTEKVKETWKNKSVEEIQRAVQKRLTTQNRNFALLSERDKNKRRSSTGRAISEAKANRRSSMSKKELDERRAIRSEASRLAWERWRQSRDGLQA